MYGVFLAIHVVVAVILIGFILIQQGKGAQAGAAFGSGASQTVFGSQGSGNFLSRMTSYLAVAFFILNLVLAYIVNSSVKKQTLVDVPVSTTQTTQENNLSDDDSGEEGSTGHSDIPAVD